MFILSEVGLLGHFGGQLQKAYIWRSLAGVQETVSDTREEVRSLQWRGGGVQV